MVPFAVIERRVALDIAVAIRVAHSIVSCIGGIDPKVESRTGAGAPTDDAIELGGPCGLYPGEHAERTGAQNALVAVDIDVIVNAV